MDEFVKINNTVINAARLLAIHHKPEEKSGSFHSQEHYLTIFDTGQAIKLSPEDGRALVRHYHTTSEGSAGRIATTSESAT
jgi:hypothetical protein